jgi:predicted AAA+ superfamily ATPase
VKAPKVYVRDSGLLHSLLGIRSESELLAHPKSGASWEGYVVEEAINALQPDQAYFWATHQGAELDLLLLKDGRRVGIEIKRADAPTMTPSMRIAMNDLGLEQLIVFYPGTMAYELGPHVKVVPISAIASGNMKTLFPKRASSRASRRATAK